MELVSYATFCKRIRHEEKDVSGKGSCVEVERVC
jgi:hypothetical protein